MKDKRKCPKLMISARSARQTTLMLGLLNASPWRVDVRRSKAGRIYIDPGFPPFGCGRRSYIRPAGPWARRLLCKLIAPRMARSALIERGGVDRAVRCVAQRETSNGRGDISAHEGCRVL